MSSRQFLAAGGVLWSRLIEPPSVPNEDRGRVRVINIILIWSVILIMFIIGCAFVDSTINHIDEPPLLVGMTALLLLLLLYLVCRFMRLKILAGLLIAIGCCLLGWFAVRYRFSLNLAGIMAIPLILISGLIFRAAFSLAISTVLAVVMVIASHLLPANQMPLLYAGVLIAIGGTSTLVIHEIERAFSRVRRSETALTAERNLLEKRVAERTKQLELSQLERMVTNQRFINFGQLYANLIHDIINPLTALSLHLDRLKATNPNDAIIQAETNLNHVQRYIQTARNHLNGESIITTFSVNAEIKRAVLLTKHLADQRKISVRAGQLTNTNITGDPVKFNQIMTNLITNAIQSYDKKRFDHKVLISCEPYGSGHIRIIIRDHGAGLKASDKAKIFDPFFSRRADGSTGLGIGLYMVRQYVEQDFNGTIKLASAKSGGGTIVTVSLPTHI